MRLPIAVAVPALAATALALLAFDTPADRVSFHPREGTVLTKTFTTVVEMALDDLEVMMNGEEVDPAAMGAEFEVSEAHGQYDIEVVVTDEYISLGEGRPAELVRSYDSIQALWEDGMQEGSDDDSIEELVGVSVRFTWDDDEQGYSRAVIGEDELDDLLLASLGEDMDMRVLLPGAAVEVGDSWAIHPDAAASLTLPGIDLPAAMAAIIAAVPDDELLFGLLDPNAFTDSVDDMVIGDMGEITCTYEGIRELEGAEVGVISLTSETDESFDLSDMIAEIAESEGQDMGGEVTLEIGMAFELEGELLWNMAAGHAHSMNFEAEATLEFFGEVAIEDLGMDMGAEAEASGTLVRRVTFE